MVIQMYSITQGYGFCGDGYIQVFFRVEDFIKSAPTDPQPILGEQVEVDFEMFPKPKASKVKRIHTPTRELAKVTSFDSNQGWGFAKNHNGVYFIHKSDFVDSFIPVIGSTISLYPGIKANKPRGCYIKQSIMS